jgi:hypothetical protein
MKHNHGFLFLFELRRFVLLMFVLLLASSALAQAGSSNATNDLAKNDLPKNDPPKQGAVARCAYTQAEGICSDANSRTPAPGPGGTTTLAQMPRRMGPMAGPPMGRSTYPGMWMSRPSPAHLLIGAGIGFAVGVAAGARGNAGVRGSIGIGAIFGLIGAGIGAGIPSFPSQHYHRRDWADDDEEASRSRPRSESASPGNPTGQAATTHSDRPQSTLTAGKQHSPAAEAP